MFIHNVENNHWYLFRCDIDGILPKGPNPPCVRMADRALLAGYPRDVNKTHLSVLLHLSLHFGFWKGSFLSCYSKKRSTTIEHKIVFGGIHHYDVIIGSVSNHQPHDYFLNFFLDTSCRSKKTSKLPRHWPLCGEFTGGRWIPNTNGQ